MSTASVPLAQRQDPVTEAGRTPAACDRSVTGEAGSRSAYARLTNWTEEMKAIIVREFGTPEVMRVEEVRDPTPGPEEVVVRVRAAGVNPVDTYRRSGNYGSLPELPFTPGSDAAGEIMRVGSRVTTWREGDRVYTDHRARGAYAEQICCHEETVHALPDGVSYAAGAALGVPYATAFRALFYRGSGRTGERVLIHGATGGVGLAAVQLARSMGMQVVATGGSEQGRALAREQGAEGVLDHSAPDHAERLEGVAGEEGFDVILEMLANENLPLDLRVVGKQGRIVVIGSRGPVEIDPRASMANDADIRGMLLFNTPIPALLAIHSGLRAGLARGDLRPVIAAELPLAEAPAAHHHVMEAPHTGKVVLTV